MIELKPTPVQTAGRCPPASAWNTGFDLLAPAKVAGPEGVPECSGTFRFSQSQHRYNKENVLIIGKATEGKAMFIPEATFLVVMLATMGGILLIRSGRGGK